MVVVVVVEVGHVLAQEALALDQPSTRETETRKLSSCYQPHDRTYMILLGCSSAVAKIGLIHSSSSNNSKALATWLEGYPSTTRCSHLNHYLTPSVQVNLVVV